MTASAQHPVSLVRELLSVVIDKPATLSELTTAELDLALRLARRVRLLGRLAVGLQREGVFDTLPRVAKDQLLSALAMADARARLALWELDRIERALQDKPSIQPVALKGCAYLLLELPNAPGRVFADVDLLLPEQELEQVEARLNARGWQSQKLSPYDQRYYRKWTHELPPLVHLEREVEIDLHHNVLPRTARLKLPAERLLQEITAVAGTRYHVLASEDMVLHAMVHLMFDADMADGLRDLVDIDDLVRHFASNDTDFWAKFVDRAAALNLQRPAYYGLRYLRQLLNSPIPDSAIAASSVWAPLRLITWLMDRLVPRALFPQHPDHPSRLTSLSRLLLFVRSHWIRMPPWLLAYHLSYKFYVKRIRRLPKPETARSGG